MVDFTTLSFTRQESKTYKVSDIYGSRVLVAPKGYEFTGEFRIPDELEPCLNSLSNMLASYKYQAGKPRLILCKLPPPLRADALTVTVEQIYGKPLAELQAPPGFKFKVSVFGVVEFRLIAQGDWYLTLPGSPCAIPYARPLGAPRIILEAL